MTSPRQMFAALTGSEQDERDEYAHPRARVRFMTKDMDVWGQCGDYRELTFTEKDSEAGGLTMLLPDDEHWAKYFYGQDRDATRPIVVDLPGWRTMWLVMSFTRTRSGRRRFIEVSAVHCIEYLNWGRVCPDRGLPPVWHPSTWYSPRGPAARG
ncbi:MAG: hypothetical protein U1C73_06865, partial [Dietzia sp.]|nr:hypothetical protein [Dietzia sp.]